MPTTIAPAQLLAHWDALFDQGFFPYSRGGYESRFQLWKIRLRAFRGRDDWRLVFEQIGYSYGSSRAENWVAVFGPATTELPEWRSLALLDTEQLTRDHDFYALSDEAAQAADQRDGGEAKDPGGEWARVQAFVVRLDGELRPLRPTFEELRAAGVKLTRAQYDRNPTMARLDVLRAGTWLCADAYRVLDPPELLGFGATGGPWVEVFADEGPAILAHLDHEARPSRSDYWRHVADVLSREPTEGRPPVAPAPPDPVEQAVRRQLRRSKGELSRKLLDGVQELNLGHDPTVERLDFVARLTKLEKLWIFGTNVRDLGPVAALARLLELNAHWAPIDTLAPLAALDRLESLTASASQVDDLAPIAGLTRLRTLELEETAVRDLEPLRRLTRIEELFLQHTRVTDLGPLAAMTRLSRLGLDGTAVSDLTPLARAQSLQILWCRDTAVSDLAPLAKLPRLRFIALGDTPVEDLSPLLSTPCLEEVTTRRPLEGPAASALRARGVTVTTGGDPTRP